MSDGLLISMKAETLLARVAGTEQRLRDGMRSAVQRLSIMVQSGVKEGKLTGQVLHVRTGTLRRSINRVVTETPSGVFAQVGTNVRYAAIHEYGFEGDVQVKAHVRRSALQMSAKRTKRDRKSDGTILVRAHTMHMKMPARSFLRSTLKDFTGVITTTLRETALQAVRP